jgi:hypothetical protein
MVLTLTALAGPAVVSAATPSWVPVSAVALPPAVSPGAEAGYAVTIRNDGPSNISQLYLVTEDATQVPSYTDPSQGSCASSGPLFCSLGALRKNRAVTVVVAFPTPEDGSQLDVTFLWNTTGLGSGGGDSSHGDELRQEVSTALIDHPDFAGAFVRGAGQVHNSQAISSTNPQSTLVNVPATNIAVTVQDGPGVGSANCPASLGCFTQTSEIHVASGATFPGGFSVYIQLDKSQLAAGTNANNLDFWHEFDAPRTVGGQIVTGEVIDDACQFRGNSSTPRNMPCKTVSNIGGGDLGATLWLLENGRIQGW